MVGDQTEKEFVVAVEGIEVVKRLETEQFQLPTITFRLESKRSDTANVRLEDPVPAEFAVDDLGFHPEHGKEHWSVFDDKVVFEYEFTPGETYETIYGIREEDPEIDSFLVEPTAVEVERSEGESDQAAALASEIPNIDTNDESSTALSATGGDSESPISISLSEPHRSEREDDGASGDLVDAELPVGEPMSHEAPSVLEALVAELQSQNPTEEQKEKLRDELSLSQGSIDARVTRLQSDMSNLQAYIDALESFLDENGTGQDLIEDVNERLETVEAEVATLQEDATDRDRKIDDVNQSVSAVDTELEEVNGDLEEISSTLQTLEESVDELEEEVPDGAVSEQLDSLRAEVERLQTWQDQVKHAFGSTLESASGDKA